MIYSYCLFVWCIMTNTTDFHLLFGNINKLIICSALSHFEFSVLLLYYISTYVTVSAITVFLFIYSDNDDWSRDVGRRKVHVPCVFDCKAGKNVHKATCSLFQSAGKGKVDDGCMLLSCIEWWINVVSSILSDEWIKRSEEKRKIQNIDIVLTRPILLQRNAIVHWVLSSQKEIAAVKAR